MLGLYQFAPFLQVRLQSGVCLFEKYERKAMVMLVADLLGACLLARHSPKLHLRSPEIQSFARAEFTRD